ncbi:hypothetical protein EXIGLDRAFT_779398 [Exidia glandulosa HHB12029]|uniref:Uncharacterized protein n=1 Tax=Exidia glandulosa HHB12029 TaxID=1314781 RepID=A0A165C342_EXIGL|nr:hypothetical protein EXIGLDRAFT_779398 [Exidia glandulosa HHB12029]
MSAYIHRPVSNQQGYVQYLNNWYQQRGYQPQTYVYYEEPRRLQGDEYIATVKRECNIYSKLVRLATD